MKTSPNGNKLKLSVARAIYIQFEFSVIRDKLRNKTQWR